MKLKERLASAIVNTSDKCVADQIKAAYIAGFDHAKELSVRVVENCDQYMQSMEHAIQRLGEEEA